MGGDAWRSGAGGEEETSGSSIFDPVIAELAIRWFSPPGGAVLDPFAGGSVRGVVAALLGRPYTGIDLRAEQVGANRQQWLDIAGAVDAAPVLASGGVADNTPAVTPIERLGDVWVKRDDTYSVAGVAGGKVRSCWALAQGAPGLVTAGSRQSPQVNIVAHIAHRLGIPCRVHVPSGAFTPELEAAQAAGAEVVQHKPGHNSVIIARAREDAKARGWREIPFGMECAEAPRQTATQVVDLPADVKRIVVPVGSGMSLAGVLWGLRNAGLAVPVVGVVVGAEPAKRLDRYAPQGWRDMATLVRSEQDYHDAAPRTNLGGLELDPIYEAKCLPFLQPGDLLWVVGVRQSARPRLQVVAPPAPTWIVGDSRQIKTLAPGDYDLIFSCPPYADLEVYSDDPADLSTLPYADFLAAYRQIIADCVAMLKPDRFAAIVVGDVRGPDGCYYNFVSDTIAAFRDAGAKLYNEAILVTAIGSLPVRAGRQFSAGRKLGKTHQQLLVFVKGDPKAATRACGPVEVTFPTDAPTTTG